MLAVALALASAALYGLSDYLSGVQSRQRSYLWVGFVASCVSGALALVSAFASGTHPTASAVGWGAAAAVGQAIGTIFLMRGLGRAQMHVVGPVSAVLGAGIPVVAGLLLGERPGPPATCGIALALPAVWLMASSPAESARGGLLDGALAGLGYGAFFVALGRAGHDAGRWPVAACLVVAALLTGILVAVVRPPGSVRDALPAWSVGATGFLATTCFLLASHAGMLTVVSVLTSLYPAVTVLLAMALLHERAGRSQVVGLLLAACAVAGIAAG